MGNIRSTFTVNSDDHSSAVISSSPILSPETIDETKMREPELEPIITQTNEAKENMSDSVAIGEMCIPTRSITEDQDENITLLNALFPSADQVFIAKYYRVMDRDLKSAVEGLGLISEAALSSTRGKGEKVSVPLKRKLRNENPTQDDNMSQSITKHPRETLLINGGLEQLTKMAAANGCTKSYDKVRSEFMELHKTMKMHELRFGRLINQKKIKGNDMRFQYNQEINKVEKARIKVEEKIVKLSQWWNSQLNIDVIDLHWLLAKQAVQMLERRIVEMKNDVGSKTLYVVTGRGKNSVDGIAVIKQNVERMLDAKGHSFTPINEGCLRLIF